MWAVAAALVVKGVADYSQGVQTQKLMNAQAKQANQDAKIATANATYEAEQQRELGRRLRSQQITETAASGVTMAGAPTDLLEDTTRGVEMDAQMLQRRGLIESNRYKAAAASYKAQGKAAKTAGTINMFSDLLMAAGGFWSAYGGGATTAGGTLAKPAANLAKTNTFTGATGGYKSVGTSFLFK